MTVCIRKSIFDFFQISRIYPHVKESVLLYLVSPSEEQKDIVIIYTYVAPEHSAIYTADEPNGIEILQGTVDTVISEYPNVNILLLGDFNARTSNNLDYIPHDDISFVFNDSNTDYPSDIFNLDRSSKDKKINKFGLSLIEMCCTYDIHIMNGRLFNDKVGNFTCFYNNGKSVVDYMICSTSLFESVKNFGVGEEDFSDHFPLYCTLSLCHETFSQSDLCILNETNFENEMETRSRRSVY